MFKEAAAFIFYLIFFNCFAQTSKANVEVLYSSKIVRDSIDKSGIVESFYVLLYNSDESIYYSKEEKAYYDAMVGKKSLSTLSTSRGAIPRYPKSRGQVHKKNGIMHTTIGLGFYNYEFVEPSLNWELLSEKKKIKDIECQLAKAVSDTGDTFFAWFAPDIITTEGPFRFKGLAGLILEVYNKNRTIEIIALEIKKSSEEIKKIPYLSLLKIEDKKKFIKLRKDFFSNPYFYMGDMQVFDINGNNITKKKLDRFKKENVFLD